MDSVGLEKEFDRNCRIILHDRKARAMAKGLKLSVIGTSGVFVKAKKYRSCSRIEAAPEITGVEWVLCRSRLEGGGLAIGR